MIRLDTILEVVDRSVKMSRFPTRAADRGCSRLPFVAEPIPAQASGRFENDTPRIRQNLAESPVTVPSAVRVNRKKR
jgi:hypothetical protein